MSFRLQKLNVVAGLLCLAFTRGMAGAEVCPLVPGYASDVKGEILEYNSADPDVRSSLLVRSLHKDRYIEWDTEPIPAGQACESVTFVWLFGMDVSSERHRFDLYVNGLFRLQFQNPASIKEEKWSVAGRNGARLDFRGTFVDRHGDRFGYASLTLPASEVTPGKPVRLRVVGESAGSRIWYMTFRAPVRFQIRAEQEPAVVRHEGKRRHLVSVKIDHLAEPASVRIEAPGAEPVTGELAFGGNQFELLVPEATVERDIEVTVAIAQEAFKRTVRLRPLRDWQVYLVQHTHTDIGYTRPQTEILPDHVRFLDYALDYCDFTDMYDDDAQFRWTCEGSWAVREFLRTRPPEQIERFKRRVKEGRIEVTGMFMNMSEITDERTYAAYLEPLRLFKQYGLPVTTAMQNDVNGAPWCLVDYFGDVGIKYVTMGEHGHRALIPFDVPTVFWWESRAGKRVLAYRADHYNTGNFWGIHTGNLPVVKRELLRYLDGLEQRGYPFDRVAVQYSGYFTDNSPPSMTACDLVAKWNERYAVPRLRIATAREFMEYAEREHGPDLPVYRVAWPDWWTDGVGSAARETAVARTTQVKLGAVESLFAMTELMGSKVSESLVGEIQRVSDALVFYGEHTFGAADSIREPLAHNSVVQWSQKAAYVWDAAKSTELLEEAAMGLLQAHVAPQQFPMLVVVNTLNWPRSGLHEVYIDHEIVPKGHAPCIVDSHLKKVAAQPMRSRADGTYWGLWLEDVPAFGTRSYHIMVEEGTAEEAKDGGAADALTLENDFYRLRLDASKGAVVELFDKDLGEDLVDADAPWALGQFVYETLGDRTQLEQFKLESYRRTPLTNVAVRPGVRGGIYDSVVITGETPACHGPEGLRCELRLYHTAKLIELRYAAMKRQVFDPEGIYVAFPFQLSDGRIFYEAQGGAVRPDADLLPGTASDWQTVQNFAAVRGDHAQILLTAAETPLAQFGDINLGRFHPVAKIDRPYIYSWVMNNYWTTNFCASQQGEFRWSYHLTSTPDTSDVQATRFGWGARVPFLSRVILPGVKRTSAIDRSLLPLSTDNVLLVGARPAPGGRGIILHLREVGGKWVDLTPGQLVRDASKGKPRRVNVLGEPVQNAGDDFVIEPYGVMFVEIPIPR